jgi:hypothetical protein
MIDSRSALVEIHGTAITSPLKVQHKKIITKCGSRRRILHAAPPYLHNMHQRAVELSGLLCVCVCNSFSLGGGAGAVVRLVQMTKLSASKQAES